MGPDCTCRSRAGFWLKASHIVTPQQREEALAYVECVEKYHAMRRTRDRRFVGNLDEMRRKTYLSRIAETSAGRVLHQRVAKCQPEGALVRRPDLEGGMGVRWTETVPPMLFPKSPERYDKNDPMDEPEVLVVGDDHEMVLLGWATLGEIAPDLRRDGRFWAPHYHNWAVPVEALHLLPPPKAEKRPIWARHKPVDRQTQE